MPPRRSTRAGAETAAYVSGQTTNEEGFLVQRLMRDGLGSGWVESRDGWLADPVQARTLARPDLAAKVSDIDHADAILVVGTELVDEAPILDLRVRKAVRRNGARLVTLSARPSTLDANAAAALRCAPHAEEAALAALAAALGSPRAADASLDALAERARAVAGFRPGAPSANGEAPSPAGRRAGGRRGARPGRRRGRHLGRAHLWAPSAGRRRSRPSWRWPRRSASGQAGIGADRSARPPPTAAGCARWAACRASAPASPTRRPPAELDRARTLLLVDADDVPEAGARAHRHA